jgi:hypothetical protein
MENVIAALIALAIVGVVYWDPVATIPARAKQPATEWEWMANPDEASRVSPAGKPNSGSDRKVSLLPMLLMLCGRRSQRYCPRSQRSILPRGCAFAVRYSSR